jgi:hypothetical protein
MSEQEQVPEKVPEKKSGGALILLGLLLLGGAGALVLTKLTASGDEPSVEQVTVPSRPKDAEPELNEAPPPPPPEEEPSAPPPEASAPVATKATGPSPCAGTCGGASSPELESSLRGRAGQARGCYNRALSSDASLEGKLSVAVRIGPQGTVCSVAIQSDTLGSPQVASCVEQKFRSGKYPAPSGGCIDTVVPINFVKK